MTVTLHPIGAHMVVAPPVHVLPLRVIGKPGGIPGEQLGDGVSYRVFATPAQLVPPPPLPLVPVLDRLRLDEELDRPHAANA